MLQQFILNGIITGSIYSLCAFSFALVYNTTRVFHIAWVVLYTLAPYIFFSLYTVSEVHVVTAMAIAVSSTMLVSYLIDKVIYQLLEKSGGSDNALLISSIGVMIAGINIIAMLYGNDTKTITNSLSPTISLGKSIITQNQIIQFGVSTVCLAAFLILIKFSKLGLNTRAMRDDVELTRLLGLNTNRLRSVLFLLSGALVAIPSCVVAYDLGIDPYIGMPVLLNAVVAMIIGGIGRFDAVIIGGLILGVLQALVVYFFSDKWEEAVTFTVLLLFLVFRPQGFFGEKFRVV